MASDIGQLWRLFGTGLTFALFGLGGVLSAVVLVPMLGMLVPNPRQRANYGNQLIRWAFYALIRFISILRLVSYETRDLDRLDRTGLLILANHPTLLDVIFLIAFTDRAVSIVKSALIRNPFTQSVLRMSGFIANNSGPELVKDCLEKMDAGNSLIVFPEGTRTGPSGFPKTLQRGAAHIAVKGKKNITPVVIACAPLLLTKSLPWWKVPRQRPHFVISVKEDIYVASYIEDCQSEAIAARNLNQHLIEYFSAELLRDTRKCST